MSIYVSIQAGEHAACNTLDGNTMETYKDIRWEDDDEEEEASQV